MIRDKVLAVANEVKLETNALAGERLNGYLWLKVQHHIRLP